MLTLLIIIIVFVFILCYSPAMVADEEDIRCLFMSEEEEDRVGSFTGQYLGWVWLQSGLLWSRIGSIAGVSFKEPWKRKLAFANPNRTVGRPRAATAYELVRVCEELLSRFEEVEIPLMIVLGGDDVVCDPSSVEELYRRCNSRDKTIKIYQGMWHQLIGGSEENVDLVFGDILDWIKKRSEIGRH